MYVLKKCGRWMKNPGLRPKGCPQTPSFLKKMAVTGFLSCSRLCHSVAKSGIPRWHLMSAAYLQRPAITSSVKNELEERFSQLCAKLEVENSFKCDHELRHEEDLKLAERLKSGRETGIVDESETGSFQTAQDLEDACAEELARFQAAPRRSAADVTGNQKDPSRVLDKRLLLLVLQRLGSDAEEWVLPQAIRADGETMRQAAERAVRSLCGSDLQAQFLGNAPCGYYRYLYPRRLVKEGEPVGAKVFFFPARLIGGNAVAEGSAADTAWLTREEALQRLRVRAYRRAVSSFVFDDGFADRWVSEYRLSDRLTRRRESLRLALN